MTEPVLFIMKMFIEVNRSLLVWQSLWSFCYDKTSLHFTVTGLAKVNRSLLVRQSLWTFYNGTTVVNRYILL